MLYRIFPKCPKSQNNKNLSACALFSIYASFKPHPSTSLADFIASLQAAETTTLIQSDPNPISFVFYK